MIGNRFNLVLVAAQRVRQLNAGMPARVSTKDGSILTALSEIEQGLVGTELLGLVDNKTYKKRDSTKR